MYQKIGSYQLDSLHEQDLLLCVEIKIKYDDLTIKNTII